MEKYNKELTVHYAQANWSSINRSNAHREWKKFVWKSNYNWLFPFGRLRKLSFRLIKLRIRFVVSMEFSDDKVKVLYIEEKNEGKIDAAFVFIRCFFFVINDSLGSILAFIEPFSVCLFICILKEFSNVIRFDRIKCFERIFAMQKNVVWLCWLSHEMYSKVQRKGKRKSLHFTADNGV